MTATPGSAAPRPAPPSPGGRAVALPGWALGALLAALALSVAGLTFLLGRESARREVRESATPAPTTSGDEAGAPAARAGAAQGSPEAAPPAAGLAPAAEAPAAAAPALAESAPAPGTGDPAEREAVAAYFRTLDEIERDAKTWQDPQAFAQGLVEQLGKGDSSGFDRLIADNQRALDGLRGMAVPAACQEHHRLSVALMGEALDQLRQVRDAVAGEKPDALLALPARAQALEARAKQADALGAALKQRFGIEAR